MKARLWTCGLLAAMMGCSAVDQGYEPPSRGPLGGLPVTAPQTTQSAWQPNNPVPTAFRPPSNPYFPNGGNQASPPSGNRFSPPATALNTGGMPVGALASSGGRGAVAPLRQAPMEQPPLRVISPTNQGPTSNPLPDPVVGGATFPGAPGSVVGGAERDPLQTWPDLARSLAPNTGIDRMSDVGRNRRVMRPPTMETGNDPKRLPELPAQPLLMARPEEPAAGPATRQEAPGPQTTQPEPPIIQARHEEKAPTIEHGEDSHATSPQEAGLRSPAVKMVNTRRIVLNYQVKDVGSSGVSSVELWSTRNGQDWQKDESAQIGPPCVTEVLEEGMYGFTLVAKSGLGLGKKPPKSGDLPQVWVEVDLSKPTVNLHEAQHGTGARAREITIQWSATDRNLARRPITLSYSEKADGPWTILANNIENTGRHVWTLPPNVQPSLHLRVEATDLVGNVGSAVSARPLVIDLSRPQVDITGVEPFLKK
jgi:hypothetical protein